jgi:hypothetical protein
MGRTTRYSATLVSSWALPIPMGVASRIPLEFEHNLLYRGRLRPDTSVYPAVSWLRSWREENFKPTTDPRVPQSWVINLEGAILSAEALHDLIVPLGTGIRDGYFGPSALFVATTSAQLRELLAGLAEKHEFPLFLLETVETSLVDAVPVGPLSPGDRKVLEYLTHSGGVVTSAQLAHAEGIELAAAGNRLSSAHGKSYVAKVERPRRQGNQFVDLRVAFAPRHSGTFPSLAAADFDPDDPAAIQEFVEQTAKAQSRDPSEVLADMWRSYIAQNYDEEAAEFRKAGDLMRREDREGVRDYVRKKPKRSSARGDDR